MSWPSKVRSAIAARSQGVCEHCGVRPATDIHHRRFLSRGGASSVVNGIALCGGPTGLAGGNHSGCHGLAHTEKGHELGLSVHSWDDPRDVSVWRRGVLVWLTADGRAVPVDQEAPF